MPIRKTRHISWPDGLSDRPGRSTHDLKQQIERILRWEPPEHWQLRDFETLSERVMMHTNQWVEAHDLQTFWHSSDATLGTLDALAQFADYANFADFCARNAAGEMVPAKPALFYRPHREVPAHWMTWILWASALVSVLISVLLWLKR
ncbi:hypothetical protein [Spirosoma montaniterrae]|uniref:Uncharacterized protein n=1 Tax=Spirosoma montaniterrae TaxID=1178516 RepID=A0A1P9X1E3_9BACT|nr:hypothetical protein [Spirosoma montaniterrae]AQG81405.1 hypothetical protein AWR27_20030 [Spirosoma montaniterrae]